MYTTDDTMEDDASASDGDAAQRVVRHSTAIYEDYVAAADWSQKVITATHGGGKWPRGPPDVIDSWYLPEPLKVPIQRISEDNYREVRHWIVDDLKENILKSWSRTSMLILCITGQRNGNVQFKCVDGGHRLAALKQLLAEGRIPRDFAPPCLVLHHNTPDALMHAEAQRQNDQNDDYAENTTTDRLCSIDRMQVLWYTRNNKLATVKELHTLQAGSNKLSQGHFTKYVTVWRMWYTHTHARTCPRAHTHTHTHVHHGHAATRTCTRARAGMATRQSSSKQGSSSA